MHCFRQNGWTPLGNALKDYWTIGGHHFKGKGKLLGNTHITWYQLARCSCLAGLEEKSGKLGHQPIGNNTELSSLAISYNMVISVHFLWKCCIFVHIIKKEDALKNWKNHQLVHIIKKEDALKNWKNHQLLSWLFSITSYHFKPT
jgi:hypothetical protein